MANMVGRWREKSIARGVCPYMGVNRLREGTLEERGHVALMCAKNGVLSKVARRRTHPGHFTYDPTLKEFNVYAGVGFEASYSMIGKILAAGIVCVGMATGQTASEPAAVGAAAQAGATTAAPAAASAAATGAVVYAAVPTMLF